MRHTVVVALLLMLVVGSQEHSIKHVVVLMEENRSFDHMLGWLKEKYPELDGLTGEESNPKDTKDPQSPRIKVSKNAPYVSPTDPCHDHWCISAQVFGSCGKNQSCITEGGTVPDGSRCHFPFSYEGKSYDECIVDSNGAWCSTTSDYTGSWGWCLSASPSMEGFVETDIYEHGSAHEANTMQMFTPDRVPILSTLAEEFAVFDAWFSSCPCCTNPNRRFFHAGTADGSFDDADYDPTGFNSTTIWDLMRESGLSSKLYYFDWSPACMFSSLRDPELKKMFASMDTFYTDAASGDLPAYSFLSPRMFPTSTLSANDQHPDHPVTEGERLMKDVYEAVRGGPAWNDTLLIITYDEHGGYYDHVVPPSVGVPSPDGKNAGTFGFDKLGVRIPTVAISPWIEKGTIVHATTDGPTPHSQYEHTSVIATMKKLFGLKRFLTKRDAWAATFEHVYSSRTTPRADCPLKLPDVPKMSDEELRANAALPINGLQHSLLHQGCCDLKGLDAALLEGLTQEEAAHLAHESFQAYLQAKH